ncbi:hypothetical protein PHLCEN_2v10952 [Hermanssonia centrifuga]|uniref:Uncharacterized protein n=1 Tax=Hermanssonia centrifuga TaxID=98765 RepID=A0A2R6NLD4_9APHY|nr:hypothetical protein PHLCEN_2v10952 [Hermanssonia centrifuga]
MAATADDAVIYQLPVKRRSHKQYNQRFDAIVSDPTLQAVFHQMQNGSTSHNTLAESTRYCRGLLARRFARFHEVGDWEAFRGREFDQELIMERAKKFLLAVVAASESTIDPSEKMRKDSLVTLTLDLFSLIMENVPNAKYDVRLKEEWGDVLSQHVHYLYVTLNLSKMTKVKAVFGPGKVQKLCEVALQRCHCFENHVVLMRTNYYGCFIARVTVGMWKGMHGIIEHTQDYLFFGVENPAHLLMDIPNNTIALGLRRGAFADHTSWKSLCNGREYVIRWKPEFMKKPLFVVSSPGGWTVDHDKPMDDGAAREMLRRTCLAASFGELTRMLLNHGPRTDTLQTSYDTGPRRLNMTAGVLNQTKQVVGALDRRDLPVLFRNEEGGNERISVEQALSISEDLRDLHKYCVELKKAIDGNDLASLRVCLEQAEPEDLDHALAAVMVTGVRGQKNKEQSYVSGRVLSH